MKGFNSRLDPLQAAFLRVKLPHLDEWNQRRKKIAENFLDNFSQLTWLTLPYVPAWAESPWHLFVLRCKTRDELQTHLKQQGIETLIHYPIPPHLSEAYVDLGMQVGRYPISEEMAQTVLSVPIGPHLDERAVENVIASLQSYPIH